MKNSPPLTLQQLAARLKEQALETAALRSALAIQFTRIAKMQAQLDMSPEGRTQREVFSSHLLQLHHQNGNGHTQR